MMKFQAWCIAVISNYFVKGNDDDSQRKVLINKLKETNNRVWQDVYDTTIQITMQWYLEGHKLNCLLVVYFMLVDEVRMHWIKLFKSILEIFWGHSENVRLMVNIFLFDSPTFYPLPHLLPSHILIFVVIQTNHFNERETVSAMDSIEADWEHEAKWEFWAEVLLVFAFFELSAIESTFIYWGLFRV